MKISSKHMVNDMNQQADFFARKSFQFVSNWLEEKNLAKLKPVFEVYCI